MVVDNTAGGADETDTEAEEESVRTDTDTQAIPVFPDFIKPFERGINGGIYYTPPPRRDKKGKLIQDDPELIIQIGRAHV